MKTRSFDYSGYKYKNMSVGVKLNIYYFDLVYRKVIFILIERIIYFSDNSGQNMLLNCILILYRNKMMIFGYI